MASSMMGAIFTQLLVVGALILAAILVLPRLFRLGGNAASDAKAMADPVAGSLLVTAITMPDHNAIFQMTRLTGVISAEGIEPFAIQHNGIVRVSQWPQPGTTLPVIVDRADPARFAIEWDKVSTGADAALDKAEALAAAMRARQDPPA
jgi:hypothetical protein